MSVISIDSWKLWSDFFKDYSKKTVYWNINSIKLTDKMEDGIYLFLDTKRHFYLTWNEFWNQCNILRQSIPDFVIQNRKLWDSVKVNSNFFIPFALGALWMSDICLDENKGIMNLISDNPDQKSVFGVYHSGVNKKLQSKFSLYYSWGIGQFLSNRVRFQTDQINCILFSPWKIIENKLIGYGKQYPLSKGMSGQNRLLRIVSKNVLESDFLFTLSREKVCALKWSELGTYLRSIGKFKKTIPDSDNKIHIITEIKNYIRLLMTRVVEKPEICNDPQISMNWIINGDEYVSIDESRIGDIVLKTIGKSVNLYHNFEKRVICLGEGYDSSIENWIKLSEKTKEWWKEKNLYSPNVLFCNVITKELVEKIKGNLVIFDVIVFIIDNPLKKQFLLSLTCNPKYHLKMKLGINSLLAEMI